MKTATLVLLGIFSASSQAGSAPQCGLFKEDSGHVGVIESANGFTMKDIEAKGGFLGRDIAFGCWINIGQDQQLRGGKMYSYRFTNPSGATREMGPYGIQAGGFGSAFIQAALDKQPIGRWSVEFLLVDRGNFAKQSIGSISFEMADKPAEKNKSPSPIVATTR